MSRARTVSLPVADGPHRRADTKHARSFRGNRFLVNALRAEFGLEGVPVRLLVRAPKNPYVKRRSGGLAGAAGRRGGPSTPEERRRRGRARAASGR